MYRLLNTIKSQDVSADNSSLKETVACDGVWAYLVPNRMQRRYLKPFSHFRFVRKSAEIDTSLFPSPSSPKSHNF